MRRSILCLALLGLASSAFGETWNYVGTLNGRASVGIGASYSYEELAGDATIDVDLDVDYNAMKVRYNQVRYTFATPLSATWTGGNFLPGTNQFVPLTYSVTLNEIATITNLTVREGSLSWSAGTVYRDMGSWGEDFGPSVLGHGAISGSYTVRGPTETISGVFGNDDLRLRTSYETSLHFSYDLAAKPDSIWIFQAPDALWYSNIVAPESGTIDGVDWELAILGLTVHQDDWQRLSVPEPSTLLALLSLAPLALVLKRRRSDKY